MSLDTLAPAATAAKPTEAVIALWPGEPPEPSPGGVGPEISFQTQAASGAMTTMLRNVVTPTLSVFRPDAAKANGVGVIVCPGGGWRILAWEHEGLDVARWLAARGYTAFLLKYRLRPTEPDPDRYAEDVASLTARITAQVMSSATPARTSKELLGDEATLRARAAAAADGRRALALVRERAAEWGVKPDRIGMIGFSAGAFLTADVALAPGGPPLAFAAPIYGGDLAGQAVPADAPPLFIAVAADDRLLYKVVEQFFVDWSDAGRPVEFHVFAHGGHGFGLSRMNLPVDRWIDLFGDWLADLGFA
jgi:acetyl esterase/lipase